MSARLAIALATFALVISAGTILAVPAANASYSGDGGVTLVPSSPKIGSNVTIDSTGWKPTTDVTITLHSEPVVLAVVTADANGNEHVETKIPAGTPSGAHTIELTGSDSSGAPRTVTVAVTISSGGGSLPRTGAAIAALLLVGTVLFAVGAALSTAPEARDSLSRPRWNRANSAAHAVGGDPHC